jgi:hypothetical protein
LWYGRAAEVDPEGDTGAAERLLQLDGIVFGEDDDWSDDAEVEATTSAGEGPSGEGPGDSAPATHGQ